MRFNVTFIKSLKACFSNLSLAIIKAISRYDNQTWYVNDSGSESSRNLIVQRNCFSSDSPLARLANLFLNISGKREKNWRNLISEMSFSANADGTPYVNINISVASA